jgi:hypothetical protein
MMLRDQHHRINTTSPQASQAFAVLEAGGIRGHYEIQSHHVTSHQVYFLMTSDTLPSSGCGSQSRSRRAALARCRGERYQ